MEDFKITVEISPDKEGYTGRECPECERYFKVKFGTGQNTTICKCPYCGYEKDYESFLTKDQNNYLLSVFAKEMNDNRVVESYLRQHGIKYKPNRISIENYEEKNLETYVTCDNCTLDFAIYGVFANCPDCGMLNAKVILNKSIEVSRKKLLLVDTIKDDRELVESILEDVLKGCVASFDGFGKALQKRFPLSLSVDTQNLFQKIDLLSETLHKKYGKTLSDLVGVDNYVLMYRTFQVRHIYEHNQGVIDGSFVRKLPSYVGMQGQKYKIEVNELESFMQTVQNAGIVIFDFLSEKEVTRPGATIQV